MRVAYITCIRNEEDLILYNLIYYYNIGIRDFYIMFNNSNGVTKHLVDTFRLRCEVNLKVYVDNRIAYQQPERFTMMSNEAYEDGCDWIIPVDADEITVLTKHRTIQEYLQEFDHEDKGFIQCRWIDFHPGPEVGEVNNYFTDWQYREPGPRQAGKIIVKWAPGMVWGDGHHLITKGRKKIGNSTVLYYAHFPNRSREQLKEKMLVIGKAFVAYFGIESERPQVTAYKDILKKGNQYYIDKWDAVQARRSSLELIYDPIDPKLFIA